MDTVPLREQGPISGVAIGASSVQRGGRHLRSPVTVRLLLWCGHRTKDWSRGGREEGAALRENPRALACTSFMLTGMHPRDKDIWLAIDQGLRAIDWEAWFGCPEGADYLSPAGHEVTARAVAGLTAFFDSRWLPKAVAPSPASGRANDTFVGLGRAAPVLQIMNGAEPGAWVEAVRWWAAYAYLEEAGVPGLTSVRRDARCDVTLSRFLHTQTQARLALMGAARGLPVELEPAKASGGPGDVRIGPVFMEVVTLAEDQKLQDYEKFREI